jgi:hypothetical protein
MFHQLFNFYYVGSLTASGPFFPVFWKHANDLCLPFGDVVHGWLAVFFIFLSHFCSYSWCQFIIPKLYLNSGTANDPNCLNFFFALNSVPKTIRNLLKYFFFNFSFSFSCFVSRLSSILKYLHACLGSSSLMSPQMCFLYVFCHGLYLF